MSDALQMVEKNKDHRVASLHLRRGNGVVATCNWMCHVSHRDHRLRATLHVDLEFDEPLYVIHERYWN